MANIVITKNQRMTERDRQVYNAYLTEVEDGGEDGARARASRQVGLTEQAGGAVINKCKAIMELKKNEMMDTLDASGRVLDDLKSQVDMKHTIVKKIMLMVDDIETKEIEYGKEFTRWATIMDEVVELMEGSYSNDEQLNELIRALLAKTNSILKVIHGKNSPIHFLATKAEIRKQLTSVTSIIDSHSATIARMMQLQEHLKSLNPNDFPEEAQKRFRKWFRENDCSKCPGRPYLEAHMHEIIAKKKKEQFISDTDTVIEVEYGEIDD